MTYLNAYWIMIIKELTGRWHIFFKGAHLLGVHLIGGHLIGWYLMGGHLIGVHLMGVHLMGIPTLWVFRHGQPGAGRWLVNLVCSAYCLLILLTQLLHHPVAILPLPTLSTELHIEDVSSN